MSYQSPPTNFLKETEANMKEHGLKPEDIIFIGSEESGHECSWEEFQVLADVEYDASYGSREVVAELIIIFQGGERMWRNEYDGDEWWECITPFKRPKVSKKIRTLLTGEFSLEEVDHPEKLPEWAQEYLMHVTQTK